MANLVSANLTNRDAGLGVLSQPSSGIREDAQSVFGHTAVTTSEVNGNTLRLLEVPSTARLSQVRLYTTALGGTCAGNIGFYRTPANGGAAISASILGAAVSFVSAVNGAEQVGTYTIANRAQPLWQALGLASDPKQNFDLVITLTANVAAGGTIGLEALFVQ